jgi:hypothetical protein
MATTTQQTAPTAPSIFQGIEESKGLTNLPNVPEGTFKARVEGIKKVQSTKDQLQVYLIAEFTILESDNPACPVGTRAKRAIGTKPVKLVGTKYSMAEIKNLFAAILNEPQDSVTKESSEALCSPKQPATGRVVHIFGRNKVKDGVKTEFTNYTYAPAK